MKIAVIGTGRVGSALGERLALAGHEVMYGSRDPYSDRVHQLVKSIGGSTRASTVDVAGQWGEVVVLAVPWSVVEDILAQAGDLSGKVLIDATNPIGPNGDLVVGQAISGGELVAGWAPGAQVVKAFNAVGANVMAHPDRNGEQPCLFLCGDSVEAKRVVMSLGYEIGFNPIDSGSLPVARYLEPLAMLWAQLAYHQAMGGEIAFKIIGQTVGESIEREDAHE